MLRHHRRTTMEILKLGDRLVVVVERLTEDLMLGLDLATGDIGLIVRAPDRTHEAFQTKH